MRIACKVAIPKVWLKAVRALAHSALEVAVLVSRVVKIAARLGWRRTVAAALLVAGPRVACGLVHHSTAKCPDEQRSA